MPPSRWVSMPLGPVARAAVVQAVAGLTVLTKTETGSVSRTAIAAACVLSILTLPFGLLAAHLSRNHPSVYWWSGRVWAVAIPTIFAKTIPGAFDGTGPALAERVTTPFMLAAGVGLFSFSIGAQGALLAVPKDTAINAEMLMIAMSVIKLQAAYTHAYMLLQVVALGGVALGYACVTKYADVHEAVHEAAEEVVIGAAAREPFVVTDAQLHILAVNRRLPDVLGYAAHELVGRPVTELVTVGEGLGNDHAWVRRTLFEAASRRVCPNGHAWTVRTKDNRALPVRITLGEARCPIDGTKFFTAMFSCMRLEQRNAQLNAEKERLQWEMASHHEGEDDPRELLGATVPEDLPDCADCAAAGRTRCRHRTLGAMQDQDQTDEAVSCANSFDHVDSSASPTVPGHALIAPRPASSISTGSGVSLKSSVMDTVSQAAKKSPARAPPPPKSSPSLQRPTKVRSEPSAAKPTAGPNKNTTPKRVASPTVEQDPRERG